MRLLFVCLGNICRSPIAEGIMRHKLKAEGLSWDVQSAGTEKYHIGKPPHPYSQNICRLAGIDIAGQRARRFMPGDIHAYHHIYAMAEDVLQHIYTIGGNSADYSRVQLFLEDLYPGGRRSVPDPWYGDESVYPGTFRLIEAGCTAILQRLKAANVKS